MDPSAALHPTPAHKELDDFSRRCKSIDPHRGNMQDKRGQRNRDKDQRPLEAGIQEQGKRASPPLRRMPTTIKLLSIKMGSIQP